jgi:hypothetical protein
MNSMPSLVIKKDSVEEAKEEPITYLDPGFQVEENKQLEIIPSSQQDDE